MAKGSLQNSDFKTKAELEALGSGMHELLNDDKIYVGASMKQLSTALADGTIPKLADMPPAAIAAMAATGVSIEAAREDHTHAGVSAVTAGGLNPKLGTVDLVAGQNILINPVTNGFEILSTASGGGGVNFIDNGDAELVTNIFSPFTATPAGLVPTNAQTLAAGAALLSATRIGTNPLAKMYSWSIAKASGNAQGQLVRIPFTVDPAYRAKACSISFDYRVISGTFVAGDRLNNSSLISYIAYVDPADTQIKVIEPSNIKLLSNSTTIADKFSAQFQTTSNAVQYYLYFYVSRTETAAYELAVDNISVGPSNYVFGTPVTDWIAYTPIWSSNGTQPTIGNGTLTGFYRRVGDSLEVRAKVIFGSTSTKGTGIYTLSIPAGFSIDSAKLNQPGSITHTLGVGTYISQTTTTATQVQGIKYANNVAVSATTDQNATSSAFASNQTNVFNAVGDFWEIYFSVPVVGLSSSVQTSDQADTRIVDAKFASSVARAMNNTSPTLIYELLRADSHGSYNAATGVYTFAVAGDYQLSGYFRTSATAQNVGNLIAIIAFKNGANAGVLAGTRASITGAIQYEAGGSLILEGIKVGDQLTIRGYADVATTLVAGSPDANYIGLARISGPSAIAANELIEASYYFAANTAVGANAVLNFSAKESDSHGAVTTGVSWKFTAPVSGKYVLGGNFHSGATANNISVYKNNVNLKPVGGYTSTQQANSSYFGKVDLLAGDFIDIRTANGGTISGGAMNGTNTTNITIYKIGF